MYLMLELTMNQMDQTQRHVDMKWLLKRVTRIEQQNRLEKMELWINRCMNVLM